MKSTRGTDDRHSRSWERRRTRFAPNHELMSFIRLELTQSNATEGLFRIPHLRTFADALGPWSIHTGANLQAHPVLPTCRGTHTHVVRNSRQSFRGTALPNVPATTTELS